MLTKTMINGRIRAIRGQVQIAKQWNDSVTGKKSTAYEMYEAVRKAEELSRELSREIRDSFDLISFQKDEDYE